MADEKSTTGLRLQQERARLGLTQAQFATAIDRNRHTVAWWETGRSSPTLDDMLQMARIGVDASWLLHGERARRHAGRVLDWELMGLIVKTLHAWLDEQQLELDSKRTGELLDVLYEAIAAQENQGVATIQRMLKLVA